MKSDLNQKWIISLSSNVIFQLIFCQIRPGQILHSKPILELLQLSWGSRRPHTWKCSFFLPTDSIALPRVLVHMIGNREEINWDWAKKIYFAASSYTNGIFLPTRFSFPIAFLFLQAVCLWNERQCKYIVHVSRMSFLYPFLISFR